MSTITTADLRKMFAGIGHKIRVRTVSFQDLARCDVYAVKIFNKDGKEMPSIFVDGEREKWLDAINLRLNLRDTHRLLGKSGEKTFVFS